MEKTNQAASQMELFSECVIEKMLSPSEVRHLQEEKAKLEEKVQELEKENAKLKIKADAFDELISSSSLFTTTVIAKSFGWSAQRLNLYLKGKKVQYQQNDVWVLYSKYQNKGYTRICWYEYATNSQGKPLTKAHTYWTSTGLLFIRQLLKDDGLLSD